jgi:hypothetical protein
MFRSFKQLSQQVVQAQGDHSLFSYLKKAGSELASTNKPSDLDSLVRIVSAINSFKYPAFNPTLKQVVSKNGDQAWLDQLIKEAELIPQGKALRYFTALSSRRPRSRARPKLTVLVNSAATLKHTLYSSALST